MNRRDAIKRAKQFASDGPRVSAVFRSRTIKGDYQAVPGFSDSFEVTYEDDPTVVIYDQILLITPDGEIWSRQK